MYGAWWCPHCVEQKEKFAASFEYVPYVECGIKGETHAAVAGLQRRKSQPLSHLAISADGRTSGAHFHSEELSDRTGCPLP